MGDTTPWPPRQGHERLQNRPCSLLTARRNTHQTHLQLNVYLREFQTEKICLCMYELILIWIATEAAAYSCQLIFPGNFLQSPRCLLPNYYSIPTQLRGLELTEDRRDCSF